MVYKYKLPSRLQHGDAVELRGQAGDDRLIVELLSDHMACDPGKEPKDIIPEEDLEVEVLPVVPTLPLQIVMESVGTWDVNAVSPISSTSSHGTTARRYGFRPNEDFVLTILVRPEHFETEIQNGRPVRCKTVNKYFFLGIVDHKLGGSHGHRPGPGSVLHIILTRYNQIGDLMLQ
ncbi:unnamed protein product [Echinostoma caproni]|uniref:Galectin domain-containing protein n=1 Tax=Echinostoma caproni TaxID=27848 RepID=A0A183ADM8_9TREM|nr:unnamed protein product [Echinostoma caproni]